MKTLKWIKGLALTGLAIATASLAYGADVRVFAAASLQGPLDAIASVWQNDTVVSYGGSGTIARQVSLGAPADAVILANTAWAAWLIENGHAPGPARHLISNRLVLIGPAGSEPMTQVDAASLLERLGTGRFAMGQHVSVPAGIYGHAWLEQAGLWEAMRPHLAETENVRAALALVARGEVPIGLVYASDAAATDAVSVIWTVPEDAHPPIRYPGIALSDAGADFLDHLATQTDVFIDAGFAALP